MTARWVDPREERGFEYRAVPLWPYAQLLFLHYPMMISATKDDIEMPIEVPQPGSPPGAQRPLGVPMAAAMCIGAESTPTKSRARALNAAISRSDSWRGASVSNILNFAETFPAARGGAWHRAAARW